jgi:hypothetical protein
MRWVGHGACTGEEKNADSILVGKHEEKIPLGRHRNRWENNIKMKLKITGWEGMDWIHLTQGRTSGGLL